MRISIEIYLNISCESSVESLETVCGKAAVVDSGK